MSSNNLPSDAATRSNAEIVTALAEAINNGDTDTARKCLDDDMKFQGVFGASEGPDAYLKSVMSIKAHQTIQKLLTDGDDVCAFYDLRIAALPDTTIFGAGWFKLKNKKIVSIRVVFDPSPLSRNKS